MIAHLTELTSRGTKRKQLYGLDTRENTKLAKKVAMSDIAKELPRARETQHLYKYIPCARTGGRHPDFGSSKYHKVSIKSWYDRYDIKTADLQKYSELSKGFEILNKLQK